MDIPLLGRAFRSESDKIEASELVILMTPRLVDPRWAHAEELPDHVRVEVPPEEDGT
jgi:type II secretory pathway component GspD/PulD (secretin)